jgi:hypothetical protein
MLEELDAIPHEGEVVVVYQPEVNETRVEYVSIGVVDSVNNELGLAYIQVEWDGFVEVNRGGGGTSNRSQWHAGVI